MRLSFKVQHGDSVVLHVHRWALRRQAACESLSGEFVNDHYRPAANSVRNFRLDEFLYSLFRTARCRLPLSVSSSAFSETNSPCRCLRMLGNLVAFVFLAAHDFVIQFRL